MKSTWAKVAGWGQFVVLTLAELFKARGTPHTVNDWLTLGASLLTAVALHHASNTDGVK